MTAGSIVRVSSVKRSQRSQRLGVLAIALVILGAAVVGCGRTTSPGGPGTTSEAAVDERLLAYLSIARAKHHEANLYEGENKPDEAVRALEGLFQVKPPHAGEKMVEVDEVLADTHARLAELRLRMHDVGGALREVDEGAKVAMPGSYFQGHLLEVAGMVEEVRASQLMDAGRTDEAAGARQRARDNLRQAVKIQEKVIERALNDGG